MYKQKFNLLICCLIFGIYYTQTHHAPITKQSIDREMALAGKVSLNPNEKLNLYLKINKDARDIHDNESVLLSAKRIMILYHHTGEDEKAIEYSHEVEKLAKEAGDNESVATAYIERGTALSSLGLFEENYKELQNAKFFVNKITDRNKKHYNMALIYQGLAAGYYVQKKAHQDTILMYFKKSLQEVNQIRDLKENVRQTDEKYDMISYLYMNMGMYYSMVYQPKRLDLAEEYLQKSLSILDKRKFTEVKVNKIPILNYLGNFYSEQNRHTKAMEYAREVIKLEKKTKSPSSRVAAYATLTNSFEGLKDKDSTIQYMSLYTNLSDSLAHLNKVSADKTIKKISSRKDKVYKDNIFLFISIFGIIFLSSVAGGWFYWKKNQNKLHKRYKNIIENLKKERDEPQLPLIEAKITENTINISEDTVTSLLTKLSKFERSEKFLKKDMSLTALSNSLNTNPRYLSEIIKLHKNKNFNNYLNGLRINYITAKLYDTPIFREYKISYLAETCGFSSREVFAVIFKKETGVSPSYFINQLKK